MYIFGTKLGGGIGVALSGWLLDASGYVNNVAVQSTKLYQYDECYVLCGYHLRLI